MYHLKLNPSYRLKASDKRNRHLHRPPFVPRYTRIAGTIFPQYSPHTPWEVNPPRHNDYNWDDEGPTWAEEEGTYYEAQENNPYGFHLTPNPNPLASLISYAEA